jgi:hypothetical protein
MDLFDQICEKVARNSEDCDRDPLRIVKRELEVDSDMIYNLPKEIRVQTKLIDV